MGREVKEASINGQSATLQWCSFMMFYAVLACIAKLRPSSHQLFIGMLLPILAPVFWYMCSSLQIKSEVFRLNCWCIDIHIGFLEVTCQVGACIYIHTYIWLVVWNTVYFPLIYGIILPNWLLFFRGVGQPLTRYISRSFQVNPHSSIFKVDSEYDPRNLAMDQYLLIPFLVGWTSIYQLFWCSPGDSTRFWRTAISKKYIRVSSNYNDHQWSNSYLSCQSQTTSLLGLSGDVKSYAPTFDVCHYFPPWKWP